MAERRMFAKSIVESDTFLDMPLSTRALYFHFGMEADDDGFLNNPKTVIRMAGATPDDMKLLTAKGYIIPFESGVVVIRHWKQSNYIQKDRYRPTKCIEKTMVDIDTENIYQLVSGLDTSCIQPVSNLDTQYSIGKDRLELGKDRVSIDYNCAELETSSTPFEPPVVKLPLIDKSDFSITQKDIDKWADAYPAVDVLQQLKAMAAWLDANPKRKKTRRGIKAFINNWLSREQDRGRKCRKGGLLNGNDSFTTDSNGKWNLPGEVIL